MVTFRSFDKTTDALVSERSGETDGKKNDQPPIEPASRQNRLESIPFRALFYDNIRTSRALIGSFLLPISGQTHEFVIYAMRQRTRADNLTN